MLARAGLFATSPDSAEMNHAFLRLRTLRVEVDIRPALGEIGIDQAARLPTDVTERIEAVVQRFRSDDVGFHAGPGNRGMGAS